MRRNRVLVVAALVMSAAMVVAACSSSSKSSGASSSGASGAPAFQQSNVYGTGVTATTVKVGVALVDFTCIEQFVDSIRTNQQQVYDAYFKYVNAHGGVAGHQVVPVYANYCPITSAAPLAVCTQFTEDDHVFVVMGNFEDFSGDAQTCVAKDHNTALISFDMTRAIINQSPGGLIVCACTTPDRTDAVLVSLLEKQGYLKGKKVAILGDTNNQSVVTGSVEPALKAVGASLGSTAVLSIAGADTSAAQAQLDSFIQKWESEGVQDLYVTGTDVNSKQFITKVKQEMPNVQLITDESIDLMYGQEEQASHITPNPYDGIITADGPTTQEYNAGPNWGHCADIYKQETGQTAPNGETVIPGPNGKTIDLYGAINDTCQLTLMFQTIGNRVGKYLNDNNWMHAVNTFGSITDYGSGPYDALFAGHYDDEDSFRLESFDPTLGAKGDWKTLTPLLNITGS